MRKSSPHSSRDRKPGKQNTFKRDDDSRPHNKNAKPFKKNYDGRNPSAGGQGDSNRTAMPYSGRVTDNDARRAPTDRPGSFGKPSFRKDNRPGRDEADRNPRKEFEKPSRDVENKPKRSFGKPSYGKDDNTRSDRKPRSSGTDSRPFRDRPKPTGDRQGSFGKPSFDKDDNTRGDRKPRSSGADSRPFRDRPKPRADKQGSFGKPSYDKDENTRGDRKPRSSGADSRPFRDRPKPRADKQGSFGKPGFSKDSKQETPKPESERSFDDVMKNAFHPPKKKKINTDNDPSKPRIHEDKVFGALEEPVSEEKLKCMPVARQGAADKKKVNAAFTKKKHVHDHSEGRKRKYEEDEEDIEDEKNVNYGPGSDELMPLNKYIAHSGECSRRDAAELVRQGKVKVNGELILDPGHKVKYDDSVTLVGKKLKPQKDRVYILLNKPKGFITTNEDPQGRKTVMQLVGNAGVEGIFPVGRLDRDTSGLLLITNDGDLTQKLCHPSFEIKKVYQVTLDKPLTKADFEKIIEGVELEDGKAIVDALAYLETKNELGLEIHSGKNRIVRRIFESLGYVVEKLDRVMYAGLTKKNLPRGKWRHLDPREVILLKHFKS